MFEGLRNRFRNTPEEAPDASVEKTAIDSVPEQPADTSGVLSQEERDAINRRSRELQESVPHALYADPKAFNPQRLGAYAVLPPDIWDLSEHGTLEEQARGIDQVGRDLQACDWWPKWD